MSGYTLRPGFLVNERQTHREIAPGVNYHFLEGALPTGNIQIFFIDIDLTNPDLYVDALLAKNIYLNDEAQWARQPVSALVHQSNALAGVNANFFEINATHNPRGIHISNGQLLKSHNVRWHSAACIGKDGKPYFGKLHWSGNMRRAGTTEAQEIYGLNATTAGPDGIVVYRPPFLTSPGRTEDTEGPVVELIVENVTEPADGSHPVADIWGKPQRLRGVVKHVRQDEPGVTLAHSFIVISGRGEGARYLSGFKPGDEVEVAYGFGGEQFKPAITEWRDLRSVVCGNVMLLKNGEYCDERVITDENIHPRTFIATTEDQTRLFLVAVDGRTEKSIGMTFKQAADFFLHIGAYHALNVDGGGSTTLAIRDTTTGYVKVINAPSDGEERPVPDGMAVFSRSL